MEVLNSCCCCLQRPCDRDLRTPYTRLGLCFPEVYLDLLEKCFNIHLTVDDNEECGICEVCVSRLRDASDFKLQVQRSQAELQARVERALHDEDEKPAVKLELFDDDDTRVGHIVYKKEKLSEVINEDQTTNHLLKDEFLVRPEMLYGEGTRNEWSCDDPPVGLDIANVAARNEASHDEPPGEQVMGQLSSDMYYIICKCGTEDVEIK